MVVVVVETVVVVVVDVVEHEPVVCQALTKNPTSNTTTALNYN